jgi:ubiquinone/menaquinone biosynthesis C-methylase UbiE
MEKLLSFIPHKHGSILDVACGTGASTRYLQKYYSPRDTIGINISEKQLGIAREIAPRCTFARMDATDLKFENSIFDAVICVEAAFHFDTRELFFREACRVLKPGGHLVLSDILMNLEAEKRRKFRNEKNYVQDLREYSAVVGKAGFQDIAVVDATEQCWREHFRRVVRYFHDQFYFRQIDRKELGAMLDNSYRLVPDMEYYILVKAVKPQ